MFIKITNSLSRNIEDAAVTINHDFDSIDRIEYPKVYLESIMQNLIQNAIKYRNPERKSWVKVKTELSNKGLVLHVEDNGLGIDLKKHGRKLFGLRKTFHKNEDARGVGLFITKAQINSMGGEVEVKSIVNKGSKFSVYFDANNE
jgi:light-regulated signal transduction histidine kinase (bacteriophytochrome)